MRLLHITDGAVAVAGGIILALRAIKMAGGPAEKPEADLGLPIDPSKIAVFPLAVPYLLNPVGITVIIMPPTKSSRSQAQHSSWGSSCSSVRPGLSGVHQYR